MILILLILSAAAADFYDTNTFSTKCRGGEIDGEILIYKYSGTKYIIKKESL